MELTNEVTKIKEWFDIAGITKDTLDVQHKVLLTEYNELLIALKTNDKLELLDACSDIVFVATGISYLTNNDSYITIAEETISVVLPRDAVNTYKNYLNAVIESNYTKFGDSVDIAIATEHKYRELGIHIITVSIREDLYVFKSADDYTNTELGIIPKGKILKSVSYKTPKAVMEQ